MKTNKCQTFLNLRNFHNFIDIYRYILNDMQSMQFMQFPSRWIFHFYLELVQSCGGLGGQPFKNFFRKKIIPESEGGLSLLSSRFTIKIKIPNLMGGGLKVNFQKIINIECGNIIQSWQSRWLRFYFPKTHKIFNQWQPA